MRTVSVGVQPSLFGSGDPTGDPPFSTLRRFWLDTESWVDLAPGWLTGPERPTNWLARAVTADVALSRST
jgi:hypothetical protein